jgi:signal transduction histidine kinase
MRFFSVRNKFIFLLITLFFLFFIIISAITGNQRGNLVRTQLNEQIKEFAYLATNPIGDSYLTYKDSGTVKITQQTERFYDLNKDISGAAIIDTEGKVVYRYGNEDRHNIPVNNVDLFSPLIKYDQNGTIIQIIQPFKENQGQHRYSLVYTVSTDRIEKAILETYVTVFYVMLIASFVAVLVFYIAFDHLFIRPIKKVSQLAEIISLGNLDQEITLKNKDEIGGLASAINTMADKLKADIVSLQEDERLKNEFIMIASHNLRTPLTIISGYLEAMESMDADQKMKEFFTIVSKNTQKLSKLTEDMITISTVESGSDLIAAQPLDIRPALSSLIKEYETQAKDKKVTFSHEISISEEKCYLTKAHFNSAIGNILENALKFTNEGGEVVCKAEIESKNCVIHISDNGPGITEKEMSLLFTKFHRGTDTLHYDYEGVGIGLYISKLIINQVKGSIEVDSQEGKGTTFKITIPVAEIDQA